MTRVRLSDLPIKVRRRVAAAYVDEVLAQEQRRSKRAGVGEAAACPGTCHTCGERFPTASAWVRHADKVHAGNARWDIDLTTPTTTPSPVAES